MKELKSVLINAKQAVQSIEKSEKMADIFKALGEAGRIRIVMALTAGELCASDIALVLNTRNSVASHQLKILKQAGIISSRKEGKFIFYRLEHDCVRRLVELINEHIAKCG